MIEIPHRTYSKPRTTMVEALNSSTRSVESIVQKYLIVFTRYPEPGKTKTRLIPALGDEGAAALQKQMTEHTLATIRQLQNSDDFGENSIAVDIRFAGGNTSLMQKWLGTTWYYTPQGAGDLGDRLMRAFSHAFENGAQTAIAIGIDCPDITADLLNTAFRQLNTVDVVLGPANDGGYYLIGLSTLIPDLFQGIQWGTEIVLQQTLSRAIETNRRVVQLQRLSDVDRPEDLPIWEEAFVTSPLNSPPQLSIIIPVINEGHRIGLLLEQLLSFDDNEMNDVEIIVVDGGSQDNTVAAAQTFNIRVLVSPPGRANQMNTAAQIANGDVLLFLHADTVLPENFHTIISETLLHPHVVAGGFELKIQGNTPTLRLVEWGVKWRSYLFQMPYGDQGLFLKRTMFEDIGGFANLPIMEDFELIQRLKRKGQVRIAPAAVTTSGRRWEKLGVFKTTIINQAVILGYLCGISPTRLASWYRGSHRESKPL